ncbi:MMPL family transporter [Nakamurella flava]|uniref:MMPL family transporter n=1 Tax=Nakamurella flava TaxID=2576308 RepID=A0A4U6QBK4_9ACTN|nr:MMPL family transporter [Nakamurella flava]TKV57292.1 MMPL family transporter [Nakamurella flava]
MLARLGRWIARHAGLVVVLWVVATALGFTLAVGGVGEGLFARLATGEPSVSGEASAGRDLLDERATDGPSVTLLVRDAPFDSTAVQAAAPTVVAAAEAIGAIDGVARVDQPLAIGPESGADPTAQAARAALVAADGSGFLVTATLDGDLDRTTRNATQDAVEQRLDQLGVELAAAVPGSSAQVGGGSLLFDTITRQVEKDLVSGELIALPLSLFVMVLVFGGFLAAGMPIVGAVASIAGALVALLGFSYVLDLDASVVNVVTVLGLGLSIDYGLLIVSRYREELRDQLAATRTRATATARTDALAATMATAGRTVLFSGVTVAISLAGLLVFRAPLLRAVGAAGVSVVAVALLVSLTLIPAVLALAGRRMLRPGLLTRVPGLRSLTTRFGDVPPDEGFFSRLARRTQRRPVLVLVGVVVLLGLLAAPALRLEVRNSGVELLPPSAPDRQFFDELTADYPAAAIPAFQVVAPVGPQALAGVAERTATLPGVRAVTPPRAVGAGDAPVSTFAVVMTIPDPGSTDARAAVQTLRAERDAGTVPGGVAFDVTGSTAFLVDFTAALAADAPLAAAVVVLATFVLLFLLTGSLLIPLKALLMNVISLGASIGVLVWVFQDGHGEDLLGFASTGGVESIIPVLVLAMGFGLAMDYEVFLLARIKEFRDAGVPNDEAVVRGLQKSGRIITSAALIVVLVFSGFVAGQLLVIKQTGVALAVAVAVDATVVRCLLVPATMTLLGEWNWWAPAPLRRLYARIGLRH